MRILAGQEAIIGHLLALRARLDPQAGARMYDTFGAPQPMGAVVEEIIARVRRDGDDALVDLARRIDATDLAGRPLVLDPDAIRAGARAVSPELDRHLHLMLERLTRYAEASMPERTRWFPAEGGRRTGIRFTAIERAGAYVPAGRAASTPLISTVLMNLVPARVAGVRETFVASPCRPDGSVDPGILRACELAGVSGLLRVGGAQAVAAMAYGTRSVPACGKVVGPGNAFVQEAKRRLYGVIDIDMVAGPSEIAVVADASADPAVLAADLLSQAEHDPLAASVLFAWDRELLARVDAEVTRQLPSLPRRDLAERSLAEFGALCLSSGLEEACRLVDEMAPEHLELALAEPGRALDLVRHAGAIFLGHHTPEVAGDYVAGPSHTLPTCGAARLSGGITVHTFLKSSSLIAYSAEALAGDLGAIAGLARAERLEAHARSAEARFANRKE